MFVVVIR